MDSKQTVMALYGAYATGDAEQIADLLHDEVVMDRTSGECDTGRAGTRSAGGRWAAARRK